VQRTNQRWFVGIILLLCLLALPVGLLSHKSAPKPSTDNDFEAANPFSMKFKDHIQVLRLTGVIMDRQESSIFGSGDSASAVLKSLRKAGKDNHIKAILLRINSPGGTVPASQELSDEIIDLRSKNKPVVVSMGDLAASGGYYISSAADTIIAEPGTLTGSIGVILSTMNLKGLGDKLGVVPEVVKSGKFKDIGSPYRPMTPEDRAILQDLILDSYDQFVSAVAKGRKMKVDDVKKIADGRIYSGRQALKLGLVDKLGGYDTAIEALQTMCKDRYHLKDNLPVDDGGSEFSISSLFESSARYVNPRSALSEETILKSMMPEFLNHQFYRQPLWIMQQ
jgi:protease-4